MNSIVRGTLFTVAMRWTDRLIGLLSTLVLARLLLPQDFGIIAMATLVIALADLLFDLGVHATLIQNPAPSPSHFDTAWTLGLLQAAAVALALQLCAPFAAHYFHESRLQSVIQVLALSLLLNSLENIGVVNFQREMRFGQDYVFLFCKRFSGFLVTLACAWWLRSYWALVLGTLGGRLVGVACSYAMHPMRA
jgi:lipopolysaccharide exporter